MSFKKLFAFALALSLLPGSAFAQTQPSVRQHNAVTAGHLATWTGNNLIQDGGIYTPSGVNVGTAGNVAYYASNGSVVVGTSSINIASNGNVGIGTSNVLGQLEVGSGQIQTANGSNSLPSYSFFSSTNDGITLAATGQLSFISGGNEALRVNSSGISYQGSAAGYELQDQGSSSTIPNILPNRADTKAGIGANSAGNISLIADNAGTATEILRITGAASDFIGGNVGISSSTPLYALDVKGGIRNGAFQPISPTALTSNVTVGSSIFPVVSATAYPTSGLLWIFHAGGASEIVSYSGTTSTSFTGITHGLYGTTGASWAIGDFLDPIVNIVTANSTAVSPLYMLTNTGRMALNSVPQGFTSANSLLAGGSVFSGAGAIVPNSTYYAWGQNTAQIVGSGNNSTADFVEIVTDNLVREYINGSGNIGIGTATPQNLLDVNGAASIGYNVAAPSNGLIVSGGVGLGTASPGANLLAVGVGSAAIASDGGMTLGAPTGGDKGAGTLNVASNLYVNNVAVGAPSGSLISVVTFTSGGTYTPTAGTNSIVAYCIGGGGGGGGVGSTGSAAGGAGGATSLGSLCAVGGGGGGALGTGGAGSASGGAGGTATTGTVLLVGTPGVGTTINALGYGTPGAPGFMGQGGGQSTTGTTAGSAAVNSGAGGAGASAVSGTAQGAGSGGAGGEAIVYSTGISGTYTATIGAGGIAGTAGVAGFAGGVGGSGLIIIFQYR